MNIPRFAAIVARIEVDPKCWDQSVWHTYCGSAHCFFGLAQIDAGRPADKNSVYYDAREWLGLTELETTWLCNTHRTLADFKRVLENERIFDEKEIA